MRDIPLSPSAEAAWRPARPAAVASAAKRLLDVAGAGAGLLLLAPVFAVVALLVRLDSKGPAFFRQQRVGLNGEPFRMLKFRTMLCGNDADVHRQYVTRLIREGTTDLKGESGCYKLDDDDRITRVGQVLRRFSIDELPQLVNVLAGDMSLVGPRPPLDYEVALYDREAARRLETRPGMTGLWQVSGRNETTFAEMVDLDIAYIDGWSLSLDVRILMRTVSVVVTGRGAV